MCCRTDQELRDEVFTTDIYKVLTACDEPFLVKMKRLFTKGVLFDEKDWEQKIQVGYSAMLAYIRPSNECAFVHSGSQKGL